MASTSEEDSEAKRREALQLIERARVSQIEGRPDVAQSEITQAWQALEQSLTLCPTNHRTRILLVSCAINAEEYERARNEALTIYNDLSQEQLKKMKDSVLHLSIAHASKMLGDTEDAIKYAHEATELYNEDPQPYMILGELYSSTGRHKEAEQRCRQALLHNDNPSCCHPLAPQNVYFTLCCLSSSLIKQAKYTEAEMFLTRAVVVDERSTLALSHLVDVYYFQSRMEDALKVAQHIVELDPSDTAIRQKIDVIRNRTPRAHEGQPSPRTSQASSRLHANKGPMAQASTAAVPADGQFPAQGGPYEQAFVAPASKLEGSSRSSTKPSRLPPVEDLEGKQIDTAGGYDVHPSQRSIGGPAEPSVQRPSKPDKGDGGGFCMCCIERG